MGNCFGRRSTVQSNGDMRKRSSKSVHPLELNPQEEASEQKVKSLGNGGGIQKVKLVIPARDWSRLLLQGNPSDLEAFILQKIADNEKEEATQSRSAWRPSLADIPEDHSFKSL